MRTNHQALGPDPASLLVSVDEAARLLGLGRSRLYAEILSGRLASARVGRRRLVPRAAIEDYVAGLLAEAREAR